jgi:hypothetical protein
MTFTYSTVGYPRPCRQLTYIATRLFMHHYGKAVGNRMVMLPCWTLRQFRNIGPFTAAKELDTRARL